LERHMEDPPILEFAGGYNERLNAIIRKLKSRTRRIKKP